MDYGRSVGKSRRSKHMEAASFRGGDLTSEGDESSRDHLPPSVTSRRSRYDEYDFRDEDEDDEDYQEEEDEEDEESDDVDDDTDDEDWSEHMEGSKVRQR